MRLWFLRRKQFILICSAIIISYFVILSFLQKTTQQGSRILASYEELVGVANALRLPVLIIDIRFLRIIDALLKGNKLNSFKEINNEDIRAENDNDNEDIRAENDNEDIRADNDNEVHLNKFNENNFNKAKRKDGCGGYERRNERGGERISEREAEAAIERLNQHLISIATFDVFWRNKEHIVRKLSRIFTVTPLASDHTTSKKAFISKASNSISDGPHHFILTHNKLKVNFHLVVFRSFERRYYFVDVINEKLVVGIFDSLQFGRRFLAFFESKALETQLRRVAGVSIRVPKDIQKFIRAKSESRFTECNSTITREFNRVNAVKLSDRKFRSKMNDPEFTHSALDLLEKVSRALHVLQVPFWLSSGTCLGWFRQCGMIAYSRDVDIGVFIKDHHPSIIESLQSYGLSLIHSFGKINDSYELSFTNGRLKLDIFFFYEGNGLVGSDVRRSNTAGGGGGGIDNDGADDYNHGGYDNAYESCDNDHGNNHGGYLWNGGTDVYTAKKYKYNFRKFRLCWSSIYERILVRVPCQTEQYVQDNYGEGWLEIVEAWDWKTSANNVVENGFWSQEEMQCCVKMFT